MSKRKELDKKESIELTNKAVKDFKNQYLKFGSWYSPEIIKYLIHLDSLGQSLKYVFYDGNAGDNTFCNQLDSLNTIRNVLSTKRSFSFISKEPGVGQNHFIFGIFVDNKLLIINPAGASSHKDFYGELAKWQNQGRGLDIYLSNTTIQSDPDDAGYVSCGPICVELMRYITKFSKEKLLSLFTSSSDSPQEKEGLTYHNVDIKSIIPETLQSLLAVGDSYQEQMMTIRKSHLDLLNNSPFLKDLPISAQDKYLEDNCENNPVQEVVRKLTLGDSKTDVISVAKEIQEYLQLHSQMSKEDHFKNTSKEFESSTTASSWYEGEKLEELLKFYNAKVKVLHVMNSMSQLDTQLASILEELQQIKSGDQGTYQYIIPLNVSALNGQVGVNSNHWVGLYITREVIEGETSHVKTQVSYVDPMGRAINDKLRSILREKFTELKEPLLNKGIQYVSAKSSIELDGNINDCGPMLVYAMSCITRNDELTKVHSKAESISLGSFLRNSFKKKQAFDEIYNIVKNSDKKGPNKQDADNKAVFTDLSFDDIDFKNFESELLKEIDLSDIGLGEDFDLDKKLEDPKKQREETLVAIKKAHKLGIRLFSEGNLKEAEQEFIKALRPTQSKPSMQNLYVDTKDVKGEVLESMYHLGQIYLQNDKYLNHHAKAAAIFQYCAGFAKEYGLGNGEQYLQQAYGVEQQFLEIATKQKANNISLTDYQERYVRYKKDLKSCRKIIKEELDEINQIGVKQIADRSKKVEELYKTSTKFFVNNEKDQSGHPGLIQRLLQECYQELGIAPEGCEFTIVGLGSIAGGKMTPYSDIEFAILVNKNIHEYKEYLRNLTKLLNIKIVNLGESMMRQMGIEALSNFKTGEWEDDWFWDEITEGGIRFDSMNPLGCKSPLGRQGYKDYRDYELILTPEEMAAFQATVVDNKSWFETDEHLVQGLRSTMFIEGSKELLQEYRRKLSEAVSEVVVRERSLEILRKDIDKFKLKLDDEEEGKLFNVKMEIYRLGDRVIEALSDYYGIREQEKDSHLTIWQKIDKLQEERFLSPEGAQHIKEAVSIATELRMQTYCHNNSQQEEVSTYEPYVEHLDDKQKQQLIEKTFYIKDTSILHHFYYVMLSLQEIVGRFNKTNSDSSLSKGPMFNDSDYNKGMIHARFLEYDKALSYLEKSVVENSQDIDQLISLSSIYFKLRKLDEIIVLQEDIRKLLAFHSRNTSDFRISDSYNITAISYMLHGKKYEDSIKFYIKALESKTEEPKNDSYYTDVASILNNLGELYSLLGQYDTAIYYSKKSLQLRIFNYEKTREHPELIALSYINIGVKLQHLGKLDQALLYMNYSLELRQEIYKTRLNHFEISASFNNLGTVYQDLSQYENAIKCHYNALKIRLVILKNNSNHPLISECYNNLGNSYAGMGNYKESIKYLKKSLESKLEFYNDDLYNPEIGTAYNNLGSGYDDLQDYDNALVCFLKALKINLEVYKNFSSHPHLVSVYINLANCLNNKKLYDFALVASKKGLELIAKGGEGQNNSYKYYEFHVFSNIGKSYLEKMNYHESLSAYATSMRLKKNFYTNHDDPNIANSYTDLGSLHEAKREHDKALKFYKRALKIYEKTYKPDHPYTIECYKSLALIYIAKGVYEQANLFAFKATSLDASSELIKVYNLGLFLSGNEKLLDGDTNGAQKTYKKLCSGKNAYNVDFENIISFQNKYLDIAYENNLLNAAICCQRTLVMLDPDCKYGNHYHNLGCFYACDGDIEKANEAFIRALNHPHSKTSSSFYAEYAQFLIMNKNSDLKISSGEISQHLYAAITKSGDGSGLMYGAIEKDAVCDVLKNLIKEKNATINITPKALACYLLIKNPEYLVEGGNARNILSRLVEDSAPLLDEVLHTLLVDACKEVGRDDLAAKYSQELKMIKQVEDIISGKISLSKKDTELIKLLGIEPPKIELEAIKDFVLKLHETGKALVSNKQIKEAENIFNKITLFFEKIGNKEKTIHKEAQDYLLILSLLKQDFNKYKELMLDGAKLNLEIIKLLGLDDGQVIHMQFHFLMQQQMMMQQAVNDNNQSNIQKDEVKEEIVIAGADENNGDSYIKDSHECT